MIKECQVLVNNDLVTVFKYGDVYVQIPAIGRDAKTIMVKEKNGSYKVVDDKYKEIADKKAEEENKPKRAKKTTETVEDIDSVESK